MVLDTSPAHAAFLMIFVNCRDSRPVHHHRADRAAGPPRLGNAVLRDGGNSDGAAGYSYNVYIGTWSLFYVVLIGQDFSAAPTTRWSARTWRRSGRRGCAPAAWALGYGVGNLGGKFFGPLGLALIMGAGDIIKPAAPNLVMLGPAFIYFASWYVLGLIGFWVFGHETKGRTLEEMDSALSATGPRSAGVAPARVPAG